MNESFIWSINLQLKFVINILSPTVMNNHMSYDLLRKFDCSSDTFFCFCDCNTLSLHKPIGDGKLCK